MMGIYSLVNVATNKRYIGSSIDVEKRIKEHKKLLFNIMHLNDELQTDWIKYKFNYIVEQEVHNYYELIDYEQYYYDYYFPNVYNTAKPIVNKSHKIHKKVYQYDALGNLLEVYDTLSIAVSKTGLSAKEIKKADVNFKIL